MANTKKPELGIEGASSYLKALRDPNKNVRQVYENDPIGLAEKLGLKLPYKPVQIMQQLGIYDPEKHGPIIPGIRDLIQDVCSLAVKNAVVCGPRGGGKSRGVSFIEFFLVFFKMFDALNLGGSELQADQVYSYILEYISSDPMFHGLVDGEPLQSKTTTVDGAWIRVLAASSKSVRSPHAGGWKAKQKRWAGGILVIDEEAEAEAGIVNASLATINTAKPSVNVRCSTFHNATGSFAEVVEDHTMMGYTLYGWSVFDVAEGCGCQPGKCESTERCFREDHYEEYIDPDTKLPARRLVHKAYCGGLAFYADGWVPMSEIETMWRRMRRNHGTWEVEAMGSRPTTSGYVIKDRVAYQKNVSPMLGTELYQFGSPVTICVDWGSIAAGVEVWQEQFGGKHVLLYAELMTDAGETQIFGRILELATKYQSELREVACDIGGGGNYLNKKLAEEHLLPIRDVNFAEEKESAVAAWNIYNETGECVYPQEFEEFHRQVKKWSRVRGRIQKGDDHLCDAAICYFSRFINTLGLKRLRVTAATFSSVPQPEVTSRSVDGVRRVVQRTSLPPIARRVLAKSLRTGKKHR
jgi:hypothetical protein